jgi:hypothetical protein
MNCKFVNPLKEEINCRGVTTNALNILNLDVESKIDDVLLQPI